MLCLLARQMNWSSVLIIIPDQAIVLVKHRQLTMDLNSSSFSPLLAAVP